MTEPIRLQKFLASATELSRRNAEVAIEERRVSINGHVVTKMGVKVDPLLDKVYLDGKLVSHRSKKIYIAYCKRIRTIVSKKDPEGRITIWDGLPEWMKRDLNAAGRLDFESEGLIILSNDGAFINRLIHPSYDIPKKYHLKIKGRLDDKKVTHLEKGVSLSDGVTRPAKVKLLHYEAANTWIEMTIYEGKYRIIRRMLSAVGNDVLRLKRMSIGSIRIGDIKPGEARELTDSEVRSI